MTMEKDSRRMALEREMSMNEVPMMEPEQAAPAGPEVLEAVAALGASVPPEKQEIFMKALELLGQVFSEGPAPMGPTSEDVSEEV